ncbi:MAG TPA: c-type cytochrome [Gemmatimonadales bacterium]|nr:c-type cytochrome [Gemmatimonadales bacterium]
MARLVRRAALGLGLVVGLVVVALAGVYVTSNQRFARTWQVPASPVVAATDSAAVERGRHMVEAIGKCADCHGDDLGGKTMIDDAAMGRLYAPNLTRGQGGIGARSDAELERAIRHGLRPDGRPLLFMPAEGFQVMSDGDLADVLAYLRTVPPVDRTGPAPRVGPMARSLYLFTKGFPLVPADLVDHPTASKPPVVARGATVEYGAYLAALGGCRSCHGDRLDGTGDPKAPNLVAATAEWQERDFAKALRTGTRPDGSRIDPLKMPWPNSGKMTDDEIQAVWLYLRSLPATQVAGR